MHTKPPEEFPGKKSKNTNTLRICPILSDTMADCRVERFGFVLFWSFFPGVKGLSKGE